MSSCGNRVEVEVTEQVRGHLLSKLVGVLGSA